MREILRFIVDYSWKMPGIFLEGNGAASGTEWSEPLCALLILPAPFWIFSSARAYSTVNAKSENVESVFVSWHHFMPLQRQIHEARKNSRFSKRHTEIPLFPNFALFCSIFGKCGTGVCLKRAQVIFLFLR